MGLTGDWAALAKMIGKLERVSEAKGELLEGLGEEIIDLVKQGFDASAAPDGAEWEPTVAGNKPLAGPTGNLKSGWHPKSVGGDSVTVGPSVFYAAIHQGGTNRAGRGRRNRIPARPMVPDGDLPPKWQDKLEREAINMLTAYFAE
jgi:phage gpG-like protein